MLAQNTTPAIQPLRGHGSNLFAECCQLANSLHLFNCGGRVNRAWLAEGEGFEPPLGLLLSLISSQVPSTTQPPFPPGARALNHCARSGNSNSAAEEPSGIGNMKTRLREQDSSATKRQESTQRPLSSTRFRRVVRVLKGTVSQAAPARKPCRIALNVALRHISQVRRILFGLASALPQGSQFPNNRKNCCGLVAAFV